ncbi:MAG: phosphatidylserine/phosphatidylglycerophosphate/cardiolipin synthase family protein [Wenzhouxiangella sp.]|nr:MAG: phosphatidylserine/phosphatidylglycerophosphate/cardiolipin synthase family protein [Wenzhouxiangella sp.]
MTDTTFRLLPSGASGLAQMARLVERAEHNIQLQTYIYRDDRIGRGLREQLIAAARRGVRVRILVDALGSFSLGADFFALLEAAGGELRVFNPLRLRRFSHRNHRKLLVCDREHAVVGGFNVGDEYDGDGVDAGWLDLGLAVRGELAGALAAAFDRFYVLAGERPRPFPRLRSAIERRHIETGQGRLLLSGPGRGHNPLKAGLLRDLGRASDICIISPYFLPPWSLRRRLMKCVRKGGRVRLLLPGKSDVALARYASRAIYPRLIRAGIEVLEYQPQVLHAKLVIADDTVFVGSANVNTRSLHIDYELMLRLEDASLTEQARGLFEHFAGLALAMDRERLRRESNLWIRLRQRFAYFVMARLDPLVARWLWRRSDQHLD